MEKVKKVVWSTHCLMLWCDFNCVWSIIRSFALNVQSHFQQKQWLLPQTRHENARPKWLGPILVFTVHQADSRDHRVISFTKYGAGAKTLEEAEALSEDLWSLPQTLFLFAIFQYCATSKIPVRRLAQYETSRVCRRLQLWHFAFLDETKDY